MHHCIMHRHTNAALHHIQSYQCSIASYTVVPMQHCIKHIHTNAALHHTNAALHHVKSYRCMHSHQCSVASYTVVPMQHCIIHRHINAALHHIQSHHRSIIGTTMLRSPHCPSLVDMFSCTMSKDARSPSVARTTDAPGKQKPVNSSSYSSLLI